jgi:hypothetical protein
VRSPRQKTAIAIWIHPKQEHRLSRLKPLIGIERRKRAEQKNRNALVGPLIRLDEEPIRSNSRDNDLPIAEWRP